MTAAIKELDRRSLGVLSGGHCSVDLCQGAVPALLPFLIADRHYSYAAAGMLVLAATIGSSLVQPRSRTGSPCPGSCPWARSWLGPASR